MADASCAGLVCGEDLSSDFAAGCCSDLAVGCSFDLEADGSSDSPEVYVPALLVSYVFEIGHAQPLPFK